MRPTAFDDLYPQMLSMGGTTLISSDGSNSGYTGGDVLGEPGDVSVVGLGSTVSLSSNLGTGVVLGDVLTIIQETPALARFATSSNTNTTDRHVLQTITASGAAVEMDIDVATTFDITLTANCTLSISNPPPSGVDARITVILRQGGSGSYTVTWPGSVYWQDSTDGGDDGTAPTLWTAVDAVNVVELSTLDGGTTWGGSYESASGTASPLTTKGDLYTYATADARLAVGSNGTTLLADSAASTGLRWSASASVGQLLISDTPAGTPLVFADIIQDEAQTDLVYADV